MRALIAEYTVFNSPELAPEGAAMLKTLTGSFERCGYEVYSPKRGEDFAGELKRLAPECDVGLVIAPDDILSKFTKIIEDNTRNIGCGSLNIALCSNKRHTGSVLSSHGIDVPGETDKGVRLIKKINGVDGQNMRLSDEEPGFGEFGQEFVEGENISVSLVGGRVTGDTCLSYTGKKPLILSVNKQYIKRDNNRFFYCGGETPFFHPRNHEIIGEAVKCIDVLGCQGYTGIDMVVSENRICVVDVNPRPTTSLTGICSIMEEEIADILVESSKGNVPDCVHLKGRVSFNAKGGVTTIE
ncbi:putative ATP-grasp superfamily ATP-dependent carboligase [Methanomicrobium sp. W14]|uniref:ATP-grasp domain-containing protein n=1 Tax=Methanomicrobium sp. W14 TaxID=2817839 RepID=UPI001AE49137|nr:ATP-grasp domain-containing protein [Methanomicrobium sp. W14]MBP2132316.1 putative ATP-grasp superfamily ATP-dependent carboligase [Methanomicrobium sp. W14]